MLKKDNKSTINDLKEMLMKFRDEREWKQFHTPNNLAQAISIEANELMEEFLWKTDEEIEVLFQKEEFRQKVSHELADVVTFCLNFANAMDIDVSQSIHEKMKKNQTKYPVEKSKGNATKYTQL